MAVKKLMANYIVNEREQSEEARSIDIGRVGQMRIKQTTQQLDGRTTNAVVNKTVTQVLN